MSVPDGDGFVVLDECPSLCAPVSAAETPTGVPAFGVPAVEAFVGAPFGAFFGAERPPPAFVAPADPEEVEPVWVASLRVPRFVSTPTGSTEATCGTVPGTESAAKSATVSGVGSTVVAVARVVGDALAGSLRDAT